MRCCRRSTQSFGTLAPPPTDETVQVRRTFVTRSAAARRAAAKPWLHGRIRQIRTLSGRASTASALIAVGLAATTAGSGPADLDEAASARLKAAIVAAVQARVGPSARVSVADVAEVRLAAVPAALLATPDPSARLGAPARFVIADGVRRRTPVRIGEATATVVVVADAVRTTHPIQRGTRLGPADVTLAAADLAGRPMKRLPSLEDVVGARTAHDLSAAAIVMTGDLIAQPVVRTGDVVRARVHVGQVELTGQLVAAENGRRDAVIRVVNQESRHALRARVLGAGEVEVVDVR